jgi:N-acetyl-gamma-glutamyl-phosphate reductase
VTGYSGGGKKMIAEYESQGRGKEYDSPRQYALAQKHKHLDEMIKVCGLTNAPIFNPIVADYYSGMAVTVPVFSSLLNKNTGIEGIIEIYRKHYENSRLVKVLSGDMDMLSANKLSGRDCMEIIVSGNDERIILCQWCCCPVHEFNAWHR